MIVRRGEEGAALLSVLLLVAVMAVIAAASLEKLKFATRLAQNGASIDQARSYGLAAETIALFRIGDLLQQDASRTTLFGGWAGRPTPVPIDGGVATATVNDGGNCFNLNSVAMADGQGGTTVRPEGVAQFERLMTLLGIASSEASTISRATADWIDSDAAPIPGGAEDGQYRGYRTANTLMIDPSELRAVAGVRPALYSLMQPYLCALPVTDLSAININTLSVDRPELIAMLAPGLDRDRVARAIGERPQFGFESLQRFWDQPALAGAPVEARSQTRAATRWFDLKILVELGGAEVEQHSLIDAATRPGKLVRRTYGSDS